MKEAQIIISPDGSKVELEGKTFQGKECVDFFAPIQKALGEVEKEKKLDAFHIGPKQRVSH
jgi:hypothetical protein